MKKILNTMLSKMGYSIQRNVSKEDIVFAEQKKLCDIDRPLTIFDVGAYKGDTVLKYHKTFNGQCTIFAFEPFDEVYKVLEKKTASYKNIHSINTALGDRNAVVPFHVNNFDATNSLLSSHQQYDKTWGTGLMDTKQIIEVPMQSIDQFVEAQNIAQIDILKLDTQGSEHLVLEGAKDTISQGRIKLIIAEMIVVPTYENQKELHEIFKMYKDMGFELYNLFPARSQKGRLRFLDGIFKFTGH